MSRTFQSSGNDKFWRLDNRPRHRIEGRSHGPIQPMHDERGLWARIIARIRA